jgi:hypothetical protein
MDPYTATSRESNLGRTIVRKDVEAYRQSTLWLEYPFHVDFACSIPVYSQVQDTYAICNVASQSAIFATL